MTKFSTKLMIAAATVVVAAGVASAQTMKAEIPFAFRAGEKTMPAGTYQVTNLNRQAGISMFRLADENSREAIIAVPRLATDARQAWVAAGKPLLSFECTDSRCALTSLWVGRGYPAFVLYQPKLGRDEHARTATVIMRPVKSE